MKLFNLFMISVLLLIVMAVPLQARHTGFVISVPKLAPPGTNVQPTETIAPTIEIKVPIQIPAIAFEARLFVQQQLLPAIGTAENVRRSAIGAIESARGAGVSVGALEQQTNVLQQKIGEVIVLQEQINALSQRIKAAPEQTLANQLSQLVGTASLRKSELDATARQVQPLISPTFDAIRRAEVERQQRLDAEATARRATEDAARLEQERLRQQALEAQKVAEQAKLIEQLRLAEEATKARLIEQQKIEAARKAAELEKQREDAAIEKIRIDNARRAAEEQAKLIEQQRRAEEARKAEEALIKPRLEIGRDPDPEKARRDREEHNEAVRRAKEEARKRAEEERKRKEAEKEREKREKEEEEQQEREERKREEAEKARKEKERKEKEEKEKREKDEEERREREEREREAEEEAIEEAEEEHAEAEEELRKKAEEERKERERKEKEEQEKADDNAEEAEDAADNAEEEADDAEEDAEEAEEDAQEAEREAEEAKKEAERAKERAKRSKENPRHERDSPYQDNQAGAWERARKAAERKAKEAREKAEKAKKDAKEKREKAKEAREKAKDARKKADEKKAGRPSEEKPSTPPPTTPPKKEKPREESERTHVSSTSQFHYTHSSAIGFSEGKTSTPRRTKEEPEETDDLEEEKEEAEKERRRRRFDRELDELKKIQQYVQNLLRQFGLGIGEEIGVERETPGIPPQLEGGSGKGKKGGGIPKLGPTPGEQPSGGKEGGTGTTPPGKGTQQPAEKKKTCKCMFKTSYAENFDCNFGQGNIPQRCVIDKNKWYDTKVECDPPACSKELCNQEYLIGIKKGLCPHVYPPGSQGGDFDPRCKSRGVSKKQLQVHNVKCD